jgi:Amt family ammonium transporter
MVVVKSILKILFCLNRYGFNPGSALIIDNRTSALTAAVCAATTTVSAAVACVTCMFTDTFIEYMKTGDASYDLTCAMNGALSGLVAITAGCAVVTPQAAVPIGAVAGWVYLGFSKFLIKMKIDDAVDAVPVHFANGIWGVLAVGLFASKDLTGAAGYNNTHIGWFYSWGKGSGDANLLLAQIISILWICGWVAATMTPFFLGLNALGMFRVDADEEELGLDISHHRGPAYDLSGPSKENMESLTEIRASHGKVEDPKGVTGKDTAEKIFDC